MIGLQPSREHLGISAKDNSSPEFARLNERSLICIGGNMCEESKATRIILIADSSNDCVDSSLQKALAPTDYALLHVRNGLEATAILELLKSGIEIAIIEEQFSAVNGFDLIKRLVTRDQPNPVRIILTTNYDRPLSAQAARELGGHAVVCKPILPEEWRTTVDAVVSAG
jgi:DNA-binding response OmpR family regulator